MFTKQSRTLCSYNWSSVPLLVSAKSNAPLLTRVFQRRTEQPERTKGREELDKILSSEKYLLAPKLTLYRAFLLNLGTPHTLHIVEGRSLQLFANCESCMINYSNLQQILARAQSKWIPFDVFYRIYHMEHDNKGTEILRVFISTSLYHTEDKGVCWGCRRRMLPSKTSLRPM